MESAPSAGARAQEKLAGASSGGSRVDATGVLPSSSSRGAGEHAQHAHDEQGFTTPQQQQSGNKRASSASAPDHHAYHPTGGKMCKCMEPDCTTRAAGEASSSAPKGPPPLLQHFNHAQDETPAPAAGLSPKGAAQAGDKASQAPQQTGSTRFARKKRAASRSISERLVLASDLEQKGLIDEKQRKVLKDLIISCDFEVQAALDSYVDEGDASQFTGESSKCACVCVRLVHRACVCVHAANGEFEPSRCCCRRWCPEIFVGGDQAWRLVSDK